MGNLFFISDTHFSHSNILTFLDSAGNNIRKFRDAEEMDERMIQNWNSVVRPQDKIYHLGDVSFRSWQRMNEIMPRLMGKKRLILGNHDHYPIEEYAKHFEKIMSWRQFKQFKKPFICCHYPLHKSTLYRGSKGPGGVHCVHGHVHQNDVMIEGTKRPDPQYINVCVEKINYTPIELSDLMNLMQPL